MASLTDDQRVQFYADLHALFDRILTIKTDGLQEISERYSISMDDLNASLTPIPGPAVGVVCSTSKNQDERQPAPSQQTEEVIAGLTTTIPGKKIKRNDAVFEALKSGPKTLEEIIAECDRLGSVSRSSDIEGLTKQYLYTMSRRDDNRKTSYNKDSKKWSLVNVDKKTSDREVAQKVIAFVKRHKNWSLARIFKGLPKKTKADLTGPEQIKDLLSILTGLCEEGIFKINLIDNKKHYSVV